MFPMNSECLIGISEAFFAFCLRVSVILSTCSLYPQQKRAYTALHLQAWTYIYSSMPIGTYQVQSLGLPKIVYYRDPKQIWRSQHLQKDKTEVLFLKFFNQFGLHFEWKEQDETRCKMVKWQTCESEGVVWWLCRHPRDHEHVLN